MKEKTFLRKEDNLIYYKMEGYTGEFCCNNECWKVYKLEEKLLSKSYNVPDSLLKEYKSAILKSYIEESRYDNDFC